jgi:ribosomal protein S18 acetylase RimI-like enzyme
LEFCKIKKYHSSYFEDCISVFKTNIPTFFDDSEQKLFSHYLLKKDIKYYVLFHENNQIIGSGGYAYNDNIKTVDLTWGMIDKKYHRNRFGHQLTEYRLQKIRTKYPKSDILLNTSQHTFKFYEKFGFQVKKITKNGYGKGLHKYDMIKIL